MRKDHRKLGTLAILSMLCFVFSFQAGSCYPFLPRTIASQQALLWYVNESIFDYFAERNGGFEVWVNDADAAYWVERAYRGSVSSSTVALEGELSLNTTVKTPDFAHARFRGSESAYMSPNAGNFTIWWRLESLTAPEGYVAISIDAVKHVMIGLDGHLHEKKFIATIVYVLASGSRKTFENLSKAVCIMGPNIPSFNTTGRWNRFSRNVFNDFKTLFGFSPTSFELYVSPIAVKIPAGGGEATCLWDAASLHGAEGVKEAAIIIPQHWERDDFVLWRFNITPSAPSGYNLIFTMTLPKTHEVVNITCPDGTALGGFDELLDYNFTHWEARIFATTTEAHGFGTYSVYTRSFKRPLLEVKVYESHRSMETSLFDPLERITVRGFVLDGMTGKLVPSATVQLAILDENGRTITNTTGLTDEEGCLSVFITAPSELGAKFYVEATATHEGRTSLPHRSGPYVVSGIEVSEYTIDMRERRAYVKLVRAHDKTPTVGWIQLADLYRFTNASGIATFELFYMNDTTSPKALGIMNEDALTHLVRPLKLPIGKSSGYIVEAKRGELETVHFSPAAAELTIRVGAAEGVLNQLTIASPTKPLYVQINGERLLNSTTTMEEFEAARENAWYYDELTKLLFIRMMHESDLLTIVSAYHPPPKEVFPVELIGYALALFLLASGLIYLVRKFLPGFKIKVRKKHRSVEIK